MWLVSQHTDGELAKNDSDEYKVAGTGSGGGGSAGGGLGVVGSSGGGGVLSEGLEDNVEGLSPVSFPLACVMCVVCGDSGCLGANCFIEEQREELRKRVRRIRH